MKEEETIGFLQEYYNKITADWLWVNKLDPANVLVVFLLLIIVLAVIFPDKVKVVKVFFLSITASFGWCRRSFIGNKYESKLESAAKNINLELGVDYLPTNCKINWVKDTTRECFIKEGNVVVKLSYKEDKNKNLANAVVGFLHKGLLQNARTYVSPDIARSSELLVAKKFIIKCDNADSLRYFVEDILNPILGEDEQLRECIETLDILDSKGMFMQLFLPELLEYGYKLYPHKTLNTELHKETKSLLEFLYTVASRKLGEEVELGYISKFFNFRIMIIGKSNKLGVSIDPYIVAVKGIIREGYKKIYMLSEGSKKTGAKEIMDEVAKLPNIIEIQPRKTEITWPDGRKEKGICYVVNLGR